MWCRRCQQDVPALAGSETGNVVCARCHMPLSTSPTTAEIPDCGIALDEYVTPDPTQPPVQLDEWQSRRQVRDMHRTLRKLNPGTATWHSRLPASVRVDPPKNLSAEIERLAASDSTRKEQRTSPPPKGRHNESSQSLAWFVVALGLLAFCCGLGGVGYALFMDQPGLWYWGLGFTFAGQGLLVFGLVTVLARLWAASRRANKRLSEIHSRLMEVQRSADAVTAMRHGGAPAFYADLVRGASPQTLLANLKGQLDQLAERLQS